MVVVVVGVELFVTVADWAESELEWFDFYVVNEEVADNKLELTVNWGTHCEEADETTSLIYTLFTSCMLSTWNKLFDGRVALLVS